MCELLSARGQLVDVVAYGVFFRQPFSAERLLPASGRPVLREDGRGRARQRCPLAVHLPPRLHPSSAQPVIAVLASESRRITLRLGLYNRQDYKRTRSGFSKRPLQIGHKKIHVVNVLVNDWNRLPEATSVNMSKNNRSVFLLNKALVSSGWSGL